MWTLNQCTCFHTPYPKVCRDFFHDSLTSVDFFFKINFSKNSFTNIIRVSNLLDPDLARHFVRPGLAQNCLQTTNFAASRQRVRDFITVA